MTKYFLVQDSDGDNYVRWDGEGPPPSPEGYPTPVELPRFPEPYEHFDVVAGVFVRNDALRIDDEFRAAHGREAIAQAHALKTIEATLILSGVPIDGLLSAEAAATGKDITALAQLVASKAADQREAEVARRVAKEQARGSA